MPRASSIKTHPQREQIEVALSQGVPLVEIARRFTVSPSSLSRHKRTASDDLAAVLDADSVDVTDLLARVADLADSATRSRKLADLSGSAAIRARAQSTELAALNTLIDRLGVDDLETARLAEASGHLVRAIVQILENHPDLLPDAVKAIRAQHEDLSELADSIARHIKDTRS